MAYENLDELIARRDRMATATWGSTYLENATTYIWQPETLCYTDSTYGTETWRVAHNPNRKSYYHADISYSSWSADGRKLAMTLQDRYDLAYTGNQASWYYLWYTMDPNGANLRATVEGPRRIGGNFFLWCPQTPGMYYSIGETHLSTGADASVLYRATVSAAGIVSRTAIATLPEASTSTNKQIAPTGRRIIAEGADKLYPITIATNGSATIDVASGYAMERDFANYGELGSDPRPIVSFHDQYMKGLGDWFWCVPGSASGFWRLKTTGSAADGGPLADNSDFPVTDPDYDFGEVWPENIGGPAPYDPWNVAGRFGIDYGYLSHMAIDRWDRYILFSNANDDALASAKGGGPGVWNRPAHTLDTMTFGTAGIGVGAQHNDWNGFTDYCVSTVGPLVKSCMGYLSLQKYDDEESLVVLNNTHARVYGTTADYKTLPRPFQSPDGTKVGWHSEFLNQAEMMDCFWSVAYRPYPPTDLEASGTSSACVLKWLPPTYTSRRWINRGTGLIDEVNGEVLYAREVKRYHIWRSGNGTSGWELAGSTTAYYANNATTNTLMPLDGNGGSECDASHKISFSDNPGNGVWYYAVTTEEHSGLESDQLSEILQVTITGGSVTGTSVTAAKGQTDFWTMAPTAPTNLAYTVGAAAGHYNVSWTEPSDDKVRYYNLYYASDGTEPTAVQQQRIASLPVGNSTYLDWLAHQMNAGKYGVTSVDRYGNESEIVTLGGGTPPPDKLFLFLVT